MSVVKEAWRRVQGNLGRLPSASLGHYASLSFVVIGRGRKAARHFSVSDCEFRIADLELRIANRGYVVGRS